MITGLNNQNSIAQLTVTSTSSNDEVEKQKQSLQKRADELREFLKNSPDTVEISDEARALARELAEINRQIGTDQNATEAKKENQVTKATRSGAVDTREERAETAKDYNKILEDLRAEYSEEEAMRRFDKIMQEDGYERVEGDNASFSSSNSLNPAHWFANSIWVGGTGTDPLGGGAGLSGSNLQTHSYLKADIVDDEVKYYATTYANYNAHYGNDVYDALTAVYQKNMESAQSKASFDLNEYMQSNFGGDLQTSAVSSSEKLGKIAANLLKEAGVELGENDKVSFSLKEDGSGINIFGAFDNSQAVQDAIDKAVQKDPSILKAFKDEYNSVAMSSVSDSEYSDGSRSVQYDDAFRSFTYSGKEPSAVVMTDTIGVRSTGYSYQKKVSDSFDAEADIYTVVGGGYSLTDPTYDGQRIDRELEAAVRKAQETGEDIESTMTEEQFNRIQAERDALYDSEAAAANAKIYSAADKAEQDNRAAEAKQALRDLEADPTYQQDTEISYMNEKREMQKATVAQLLELFNPSRQTPGLGMINSIIDSLRSMSGAK